MITAPRRCCLLWLCSLTIGLFAQSRVPQHPLDGLTTTEYWAVHDVMQESGHLTEKTYVASLLLHEPVKEKVLVWRPGDAISREADLILEAEGKTYEARVDIVAHKLEFWKEIPGVEAPVTGSEMMSLGEVAKKDPRVIAALKAHGITDLTSIQCGAGPLSFIVFPGQQEGHRLGWGSCTDSHGEYHSWDARWRVSTSLRT